MVIKSPYFEKNNPRKELVLSIDESIIDFYIRNWYDFCKVVTYILKGKPSKVSRM